MRTRGELGTTGHEAEIYRSGTCSIFRISRKLNEIDGYMCRRCKDIGPFFGKIPILGLEVT